MSSTQQYFSRELFEFLKELKENNNREWFLTNKERYEEKVRRPFLQFISDFGPHLDRINLNFRADPRPNGGSMFRIYRDVRFSNDKSPYKTHVAAYFPHNEQSKDVEAPGFYLHIEPEASFAGAGLWHPNPYTLKKVRIAIMEKARDWERMSGKVKVEGERLERPPRDFPADHPLIADIQLKDFVSSVRFKNREVSSSEFLSTYVEACRKMSPLVEFLTKALGFAW